MCIIAVKPSGVPMPEEDILRAMWDGNPDGAGLMYPSVVEGKGSKKAVVQIRKGFMDFPAFMGAIHELSAAHDMTSLPIVMHFRITTHGGTCPELTHPFPVTTSRGALRKLTACAPVGVAHNGIIHSVTPAKDMSDTSEYIASQLAPLHKALPRFWESPPALELIRNGIGSKMAIMSADGVITTIGEFNESNGILYSNYSWMARKWSFTSYGRGGKTSSYYSPSAWENSSAKKLMNLADIPGAYVVCGDGTQIDTDYDDGIAIDAARNVYAYDGYLDVWVRDEYANAFAPTGMSLAFNGKAATWEDTMGEEEALELYEALCEDDDAWDGAGLPDHPPFALT